jgi:transcriptional regulator with XRE-family HTH domain
MPGMITPRSPQVGARLKGLRIESGWRVEEIARDLGIASQAWHLWETGRSAFNVTRIVHIAAALRMPRRYVAERLLERAPETVSPEQRSGCSDYVWFS